MLSNTQTFRAGNFSRWVLAAAGLLSLGACADQPAGPDLSPEGVRHNKWVPEWTITAPCGTDIAAELEQAVNSSQIVTIPDCSFNLSRQVKVPSNTRIRGYGASSDLTATAANIDAMLYAVEGAGDGAVLVTNVIVEKLHFTGGPGIRIHAFRSRFGQNVKFLDNRVINIGMYNVDNTSNVEVLRNRGQATNSNGHHAIEINFSRNVRVKGNVIDQYVNGITWGGGPVTSRVMGTGDIQIDSNTVTNTESGILGYNGERITVTGNTVSVCSDVCLDAEGSNFVTFADNDASFAGNAVLASFFYSSNILFERNRVRQRGNGNWPGHGAGGLTGVRLFFVANSSTQPDSISVTLRDNELIYTGPSDPANPYTVGLVENTPSALVVLDDNRFSNTIVHMVSANSGSVRVTDNQFDFDREILVDPPQDRRRFAAIHLEGGSYTPKGGALTQVSGNTVRTSVAQNGTAVFVAQNTAGPAMTTRIENNTIRGFPTAIRYRNETQANSWRIVGNTTDGAWWVNQSTFSPVMEMHNNGIGIHSWWKTDDRLWGHDPAEGLAAGYQLSRPNWFYVAGRGPTADYIQLFRCRMDNSPFRHFMSTSSTCEGNSVASRNDLGGIYGIRPGFQSAYPGTVPLYRLTHPGNNDSYVTADEAEKNDIVQSGWQVQGIIAYVWR